MSSQITQFVRTLLTTDPRTPRSIQLDIDTGGDIPAFFEVLLLIMTEMLKSWYTPPITIGRITDDHLARMIAYYASFGIHFDMIAEDEPRVLRINNREYIQKSRLDQMKFQIAHAGKLYTVNFSSLPAT